MDLGKWYQFLNLNWGHFWGGGLGISLLEQVFFWLPNMYRCDQPIPNPKSLQKLSGCTAIFQCSSRYVAVFLRRNLMATAESSIISCERHRSISPMVLWMAAWTVEGPTPHRVQGSDPCRKLADLVKNWRIYSVAWKSSEILSPVVKIKILHPIQSKLSEHSKEEAQPFSNIKQPSVCISSHQNSKTQVPKNLAELASREDGWIHGVFSHQWYTMLFGCSLEKSIRLKTSLFNSLVWFAGSSCWENGSKKKDLKKPSSYCDSLVARDSSNAL